MEGVEDIPGTALHEGITWGWESFPEYLDVIDSHPARDRLRRAGAARRAAQLRDGRPRRRPRRGADRRRDRRPWAVSPPRRSTPARSDSRRRGRSRTARPTAAPRRASPPPPTSCSASPARSARPVRACSRSSPTSSISTAEFGLMRAMAEVSGRPMSITTLQRPEQRPDEFRELLDLISKAVADGVRAARAGGGPAHRHLDEARRSRAPTPRVVDVPASSPRCPFDSAAARLREPEVRAADPRRARRRAPAWANASRSSSRSMSQPRYDRRPDEALDLAGVYDALVAADGYGALYAPLMNYVGGDMSATREMLVHPLTVPGLGRRRRALLDDLRRQLPDVPARVLGPRRRPAARSAPDRVDRATPVRRHRRARGAARPRRARARPARRREPRRRSTRSAWGRSRWCTTCPLADAGSCSARTGYRATLVAGEVVMRDGEPTGALPGRLVRGAQPAR